MQYYGSSTVPGNMTRLRIAMELMETSVSRLIAPRHTYGNTTSTTPLSEPCIAYILREVLNALVYLHSEHRMHRDIRASTLLLTRTGMCKVTDYGESGSATAASLAQRRPPPSAAAAVGVGNSSSSSNDALWMSPEVVQQSPDFLGTYNTTRKSIGYDGYGEAADIWSLGITAIELATGHPPRNDIPTTKLPSMITREPPPRLEGPFSDAFKDFVWQCLRKSPGDRPAAIDLLMHSFVVAAELPQELIERLSHFVESKNIHKVGEEAKNARTDAAAVVAGWNFDTAKRKTPPSQDIYSTTVAGDDDGDDHHHHLGGREPSFNFGTFVDKGPSSSSGSEGDDHAMQPATLSFGTVVSRVPPPAPLPPPPQLPQSPFGGRSSSALPNNHRTATLSGNSGRSVFSEREMPLSFLPSGNLNLNSSSSSALAQAQQRPPRPPTPSPSPAGGGGVSGSHTRTQESTLAALTGMLASLETRNSPSLVELKNSSGGASGSGGENVAEMGPLGNYLIGQWNSAALKK